MRISTDLYADELVEAVRWFMQLAMDDIASRLHSLAMEAQGNLLLSRHYGETFKLELAMATIFAEVGWWTSRLYAWGPDTLNQRKFEKMPFN